MCCLPHQTGGGRRQGTAASLNGTSVRNAQRFRRPLHVEATVESSRYPVEVRYCIWLVLQVVDSKALGGGSLNWTRTAAFALTDRAPHEASYRALHSLAIVRLAAARRPAARRAGGR